MKKNDAASGCKIKYLPVYDFFTASPGIQKIFTG
jgi:hypothetical protein